jgi:hypothetical protein
VFPAALPSALFGGRDAPFKEGSRRWSKTVAGLIGAVSLLAVADPAQAAMSAPTGLEAAMHAGSYADLLKPSTRGSGRPAQPGISRRVRRSRNPGSISLTFTCRILDRSFALSMGHRAMASPACRLRPRREGRPIVLRIAVFVA